MFSPRFFLRKLSAAMASGVAGGPVWRGGAGDIIATLYEDGIFTAVSPSAGKVIGAAGNLIGRSLFDFIRREDRRKVRAALAHAAEGGIFTEAARLRAEFQLLRVRRAPALAEVTFKPIGRGRVIALIRDRGAELTQIRDARAMAERGDIDDSARGDLIADLSHEMKTPLNAIMGFADAMRSETFGPIGAEKYKDYADHIHSSGAHLMDLIGSILDRAKIAEGKYALAPALTAPGAVIEDCAAMIRGEAAKAGLSLHVEIAPDLPEAMIDGRAVKQILINLLSNAVKFTSEGEITLGVSEKCGALDFTVRDTGIGMNNIVLSKLGGRFSDTHKSGVRGSRGAGLGLSLAFELARLHGGVLKINSTPGEGTTARLTLPLKAKGAASLAAPAAEIQSQLDRVNAFRRERQASAA